MTECSHSTLYFFYVLFSLKNLQPAKYKIQCFLKFPQFYSTSPSSGNLKGLNLTRGEGCAATSNCTLCFRRIATMIFSTLQSSLCLFHDCLALTHPIYPAISKHSFPQFYRGTKYIFQYIIKYPFKDGK